MYGVYYKVQHHIKVTRQSQILAYLIIVLWYRSLHMLLHIAYQIELFPALVLHSSADYQVWVVFLRFGYWDLQCLMWQGQQEWGHLEQVCQQHRAVWYRWHTGEKRCPSVELSLESWACANLTEFNMARCKVLHLSQGNQ